MSLKTDYFDGLSGLHQNLNNTFDLGVAFIGSGKTEISSLDMGDRNGSNIGVAPAGGTQAQFVGTVAGLSTSVTIQANIVGLAGNVTLVGNGTSTLNQLIVAWNGGHPSNQQVTLTAGNDTQIPDAAANIALTGGTDNVAQAGAYIDIDGLANGYRLWMLVSGQVAPSSGGRQLVQVTVSGSATRAQLASTIQAALEALAGSPFSVDMVGDSLRISTNGPKTIANPIALSAGWGTAVVAVIQAGADSTGNYSTIRSALLNAAASGTTTFTVTIIATGNTTAMRANKGNNLYLKAYLAGIQQGLADQQLYDYEVSPSLNVSDTIQTSIDLNFKFQVS